MHIAFSDYRNLTDRYGGRVFDKVCIPEIGCGARPPRLMAMNASGVDVLGGDLDAMAVLEYAEMGINGLFRDQSGIFDDLGLDAIEPEP